MKIWHIAWKQTLAQGIQIQAHALGDRVSWIHVEGKKYFIHTKYIRIPSPRTYGVEMCSYGDLLSIGMNGTFQVGAIKQDKVNYSEALKYLNKSLSILYITPRQTTTLNIGKYSFSLFKHRTREECIEVLYISAWETI